MNTLRLTSSRMCWRMITSGLMRYSSEEGKEGGAGRRSKGSILDHFEKQDGEGEDEYFYRKRKEQLFQLKKALNEELIYHQDQIKLHQEAIVKHKQCIDDIQKREFDR